MLKYLLGLAVIILGLASCNVNKDLMFKTDVTYAFDTLYVDSTDVNFILRPNDMLQVNVFTNEGSIIFEASTSRELVYVNRLEIVYVVQSDGYVELPILGRVYADGKSIFEFQDYIEELLSNQFVNPLAQVRVLNRRALLFNGNASQGTVVPLVNPNTRLIEVIATGGGLGTRANASKIKVIRSTMEGDKVYLVDLSTIEGVDQANMIVENGDVIYVESTRDRTREVLNELTPIISLTTSVLLLANLFAN